MASACRPQGLHKLVKLVLEAGGGPARVLAVAIGAGATLPPRHVAAAMVSAAWRDPKAADSPPDDVSQRVAVIEAGLRTQVAVADGGPVKPLSAAIQALRSLNRAVGDAKHDLDGLGVGQCGVQSHSLEDAPSCASEAVELGAGILDDHHKLEAATDCPGAILAAGCSLDSVQGTAPDGEGRQCMVHDAGDGGEGHKFVQGQHVETTGSEQQPGDGEQQCTDSGVLTSATAGSTHLASLPRMLPAGTTEASMTRNLLWLSACQRPGSERRQCMVTRDNGFGSQVNQACTPWPHRSWRSAAFRPTLRRPSQTSAPKLLGDARKRWASTAAGDVRRHAERVIAAGGDLLPVLHVLTVRGSKQLVVGSCLAFVSSCSLDRSYAVRQPSDLV
uniref:Uncharacterized protein n=1 Tax=Lingulaulax polyedra TaxID=160621 RepID=Q39907_LINPO|nr:ORF; putative [Lingulodinium polyedra]